MANRFKKRAVSKKRPGRRLWLKLAKVLLVAAAICGLAYSAAWAAGKAWHSFAGMDLFSISGVQVTGLKHVREDDLVSFMGDIRGEGIFGADLRTMVRQLESHPWIKGAAVKRELPDGLRIDVTERVPAASALAGGARYLVDTEGVVLARVEGGGWEYLPVITCDSPKKPGATGGEPGRGLALSLDLISAVRAEPTEQLSAAVVHLGRDYVPYLVIDGASVEVGSDEYEAKVRRLTEIMTDIRKRGVTPDRIDLRYPGKVIVGGGRVSQS